MSSSFAEIPRRIFLDSSTLQALQRYGGFIYEGEAVPASDRILQNPQGVANLDALRGIMQVNERAQFAFALSANSLREVSRKNDAGYLQWAYDVLDHWETCFEEAGFDCGSPALAALLNGRAFGYPGEGDRLLLMDAVALGCDAFLTMENRLPRNAPHIERTIGLRVLSPIRMWEVVEPWAALFY